MWVGSRQRLLRMCFCPEDGSRMIIICILSACDLGKYSMEQQTECQSCAVGRFTNDKGLTSCTGVNLEKFSQRSKRHFA